MRESAEVAGGLAARALAKEVSVPPCTGERKSEAQVGGAGCQAPLVVDMCQQGVDLRCYVKSCCFYYYSCIFTGVFVRKITPARKRRSFDIDHDTASWTDSKHVVKPRKSLK